MAEGRSSSLRANKRKNYKNKIIVKNTTIVSNTEICVPWRQIQVLTSEKSVVSEVDQKALDPCKVIYGVQPMEELCL